MITAIFSRLAILVFGTLYPAYASYKAVRTKNVKEYVKWMMYWIVFAFFTCIETFTDIFLSWLPLYYEVKVIVVLWLLNPATKGSSVLYRKFVHPMLTRREQEIDEYLNQAKERGYTAVIQLGSKGVNYATNVIMQTALKGGGNLVQTIKRSYSLSDLSEPDVHRTQDEVDELMRSQHRGLRPRTQAGRSSSSSGARHSTGMYFSEIDVGAKGPVDSIHYNIKSSEDISSGYSSAEPISGGLSRTSSMTSSKGLRFKAKKPEDENFSEYDENEYILREDFLKQKKYERSQSLIEPIQNITTNLLSSSLTGNSYGLESDLHLITNSSDLDNSRNELTNLKSETFNDTVVENKLNDDFAKILPAQLNPELQEKFQMFCQWLEKGATKENDVKNNDIDEEKLQSPESPEDDFKDTISVGSVEDNSLDKFDDALCNDAKKDDFKDEFFLELDFNNQKEVKTDNQEQKELSQTIPSTEYSYEKPKDNNSNLEEFPKPSLKENISIALDSVTKLKEHMLKLNDGRSKIESPQTTDYDFGQSSINTINSNMEKLGEMKSNNEKKQENSTISIESDVKKPIQLHHSKGKAPEPPTSMPSNFSSSNLFNTFLPYESSQSLFFKPTTPSCTSSTTTTTTTTTSSISLNLSNTNPIISNTNSTCSSPNLFSTFSSQISSTPSSSRPSSPTTSVDHNVIQTNLSIESAAKFEPTTSTSINQTLSSHSRSPSPKPVQVKPRRNIFKSYLPSIFRSESPKPKSDENYAGKETEI